MGKRGQERLLERAIEAFAPPRRGRARGGERPVRLVADAVGERAGGRIDVARRWQAFLALAAAYGVTAEAVAARFEDGDVADLCAPEHDDARLARCMETIAADIRREEARRDATAGVEAVAESWTPAPATVRCAECRHFRHRATHPHLGTCAAGLGSSAAGGLWDDQRRSCERFVRAASC